MTLIYDLGVGVTKKLIFNKVVVDLNIYGCTICENGEYSRCFEESCE